MVTVRFLSELHRKLKLSADTFSVDTKGETSFREVIKTCGISETNDWMNKKLHVSNGDGVCSFKKAWNELMVAEDSRVIVFFVMGGG